MAHDVNELEIADLTDVANVFETIQRANILQYINKHFLSSVNLYWNDLFILYAMQVLFIAAEAHDASVWVHCNIMTSRH